MINCSLKKNWKNKKCKTYYHVTTCRRANNIKEKGLLTGHRKNVPISKKHTNYVFSDLLDAGYFASEMKWKLKQPVCIIDTKINKDDVKQDVNTRAIVGKWFYTEKDINPSQIIKVRETDDKFWKEHGKRMDKELGKTKKMII